jgi:hypothetical protein
MREHETKAVLGYLGRIADALERIAGNEDDAPQRMASPQRLHARTLLAHGGIEDLSLPDCESVWSLNPSIRCLREANHPGPCHSVNTAGDPIAWGNNKQEPEYHCDVVHFNRSAIICTRDAGHMGFHRDPTGAVVWYDPDAGKDVLYAKMAENDDPEQECADVSQARRQTSAYEDQVME